MTAQAADRIRFRGEDHFLASEPLEQYWLRFYPSDSESEDEEFGEWYRTVNHARIRPPFRMPNTACVRGYGAEWEVFDGRLNLVTLNGWLDHGWNDIGEVGLDAVFPGASPPIFAWWYTGTLYLRRGKILNYVHLGYLSSYEIEVQLEVNEGLVVSESLIDRSGFHAGA